MNIAQFITPTNRIDIETSNDSAVYQDYVKTLMK